MTAYLKSCMSMIRKGNRAQIRPKRFHNDLGWGKCSIRESRMGMQIASNHVLSSFLSSIEGNQYRLK